MVDRFFGGLIRPASLFAVVRFFRHAYSGENGKELRREQATILATASTLFAVLGIGTCALLTFGVIDRLDVRVLCDEVAITGLYGGLVVISLCWRRSRDDIAFIRTATRLLVVLGVAWGTLVNLFALLVGPDRQGITVGLIMGLVASSMLGVPISAALAFYVPTTLLCSMAVMVTLQPVSRAGVLLFLGFAAFVLLGATFINRLLLERSIGRLQLHRQHETLRVFLREYEEGSADWVWETDPDGRLRHVSTGMIRLLSQPTRVLEGRPLAELDLRERGSDHRPLAALIAERKPFRDLLLTIGEAAAPRYVHLTGHPVYDRDGTFGGFRGIMSDVTERTEAQARIEYLATHDTLTGLLNRKAFLDQVEHRCREGRPFAILVIDLDRFKAINDDFGHVAGDRLLYEIGERLRGALLPQDLCGRLGGDEFVLLLAGAVRADAMSRSLRLNELLAQSITVEGLPVASSASIGVALCPSDGEIADALLRRADLALYQAKERKNACSLFESWMETDYLGRIRLRLELAVGIGRDELFVEYQPVVDAMSSRIVSAEALVRWRHPSHGVMPPGEFIAVAEGGELIEELGAYVLRVACRDAASWPVPLPVAVNLSPRQLRSGRFVSLMTECLRDSGLPPDRLVLEVTETVFLASTDRTVGQLAAIRQLGVRVVLDDFGTGYSSLTYLRGFDVDGIKIDASFIRDLPQSQRVAAIIRTIARLASDMNVHLVAEGVETAEQLAWLKANGVGFVQGFAVGRPTSSDAVAAALLEGRDRAGSGRTAGGSVAADLPV